MVLTVPDERYWNSIQSFGQSEISEKLVLTKHLAQYIREAVIIRSRSSENHVPWRDNGKRACTYINTSKSSRNPRVEFDASLCIFFLLKSRQ